MIDAGLRSKTLSTALARAASETLPVPKVSIRIETGFATPIA